MSKFKKGDLVRCSNFTGLSLVRGKIYEVLRTSYRKHGSKFVEIDLPGEYAWFYAHRFVHAGTVAPENRSRVDAGPRTL